MSADALTEEEQQEILRLQYEIKVFSSSLHLRIIGYINKLFNKR